MENTYVSLDNFIVVEDTEHETDQEVIDHAASQLTQQLMVDINALTWVLERETSS